MILIRHNRQLYLATLIGSKWQTRRVTKKDYESGLVRWTGSDTILVGGEK